MTSHISVTTTSSPTAATAGGSGASSAGKSSTPLDVFSAILQSVGGTPAANVVTTTASEAGAIPAGSHSSLLNVGDGTAPGNGTSATLIKALQDLLANATGTAGAPLTTGPAAAAAPTTAVATDTKAATPSELLANLVTQLTALDKAQKNGEPVDDKLLKKIKQAVDALSAFLGAQQSLPIAQPAANPAQATDPAVTAVGSATAGIDTSTAAGQAAAKGLADANASLTALNGKLTQLSGTLAATDPELSSKLASLAKSLDPTKVTQDTLSQLGLDSSTASADPKLATAITGLAIAKVATSDSPQPTLAAPSLTIPANSSLSVGTQAKSATASAPQSPTTPATTPVHTTTVEATTKPAEKPGPRQDNAPATTKTDSAVAAATKPDAAAAAVTSSTPADTAAVAANAGPQVAAPRQVQATYQAVVPAIVNLPQMAFDIAHQLQQGTNHFQIRLDPADLGRVDVKLSIDGTGSVNAHMTVERSDTLDLLRRDQGALNTALSQAGLDGAKTNLQFSLSQNPFTRQNNGSGNGQAFVPADPNAAGAPSDVPAAASPVTYYRGTATAGGLNLFV